MICFNEIGASKSRRPTRSHFQRLIDLRYMINKALSSLKELMIVLLNRHIALLCCKLLS
jgi:hypothetical protein